MPKSSRWNLSYAFSPNVCFSELPYQYYYTAHLIILVLIILIILLRTTKYEALSYTLLSKFFLPYPS
jgi:hypothetical protein